MTIRYRFAVVAFLGGLALGTVASWAFRPGNHTRDRVQARATEGDLGSLAAFFEATLPIEYAYLRYTYDARGFFVPEENSQPVGIVLRPEEQRHHGLLALLHATPISRTPGAPRSGIMAASPSIRPTVVRLSQDQPAGKLEVYIPSMVGDPGIIIRTSTGDTIRGQVLGNDSIEGNELGYALMLLRIE